MENHILRRTMAWAAISLLFTPHVLADEGDSIRTVTPLFPPVVIDDEVPPANPEDAVSLLERESGTDSVSRDGSQNSFPVDDNIKVGTPRTGCGVSPTGAATWTLTFDAPAGAGGLMPDAGLAYNSQAGNGIAGWGVSVTGISVITRGIRTPYYDNMVRGIGYDGNDALFLDGRRLLLSSGSAGTTGAVYVPEGDPYTTVTVTQSSSAAGPLTFEVVSPDGIVIRYGATDNSRVEFTNGAGQSRVLSWYVSSKDDPNANYMEYTYMQDHLTLYPTRISYGKNRTAGTGADNSIRFTYSGVEAGTIRTFVAGGVRGGVYKCLTEVRTMTGENVYRKYTLDYNPFLDSSRVRFERLVAVTVRNGAGEQLFPVVLDWNAVGNHEREVESFPFSMSSAHPGATILDSLFMAADMDGNGLADIIRLSKVRTDRIQTGYAYVHLASMGPDGLQYASTPHRIETGVLYDKGSQACVMGGKSVADLDGDGLSDVLVALYHVYGSERRVTFKAIYGKDIRTGADSTTLVRTVTLSPDSDMPMVVTGDIDGNGIDDILYMERDRHNGVYHAGLVRCMNGYSEIIQYPVTLPDDPKRIFLGDFNSDGLTDVIVFHDTGYSIFPYNGLLGDFFSNTGSIASTAITNQWKMEQGDFNGDGLEDVLYVGANRSRFYFALNNGDGSFDVRLAINSPVHGTSQTPRKNFHLLPTDLNHDGFTDLFVVHWDTCFSRTSYASIACWMVSDGSSLTLERMIRTHYLDDSQWYNYMLADFNGDGAPELMNYGHDVWTADLASGGNFCLNLYSSAANGTDAGLLSSATDGMGAETSFAYGSTSDPDVCTQSFGSGYPLRDAHWPLAVVRGMTKDQGMAGVHTSTCRYKGMVYHAQGRGLLGFTDKAVRDSQTGVTAQSGILSWNTYHYIPGMTYSVTTMGLEKDSTITTMSVGYNAKSRYLSLPAASVSLDMDGNTTAKTFQFNTTYGYPTLERTEYGSTGMYRQVTYSSHVRRGSRWLPQTEVSEQRHFHDTQVFRDSTTCSYDTAGNVTSRTEHDSSEMAYTMSYTYDTYGNVTSKVGSFGNMTGPPSYYQYDPTGRFVTRKWGSADAGEWQYTHDAWGNVLTETDASEASSPLTTTFQRDGWGDVSSVTSPTGLAETVSSGWGTTRQSRFYVLREGQGKAPVKTWYDICGREHVRQTRTAGNALSTETISLTLRGDISQIVRTEGNRTCTEGYTYDSRGRVNWSYKTGFGATTYTYGNRSRTATCFSRDYTTTYDAWGNVLTSSDPLSSVEYTYGSIGKPVSVTSGESEITLAYDKAGRRIRIDDPDAGTSTSVYRADGKLLSHTDGRGIQTQNTYDALGRLVTSVCDTLTTTYTYGTSGYGKLRLVKRQAGSVSDEYTYDAYGRVVFSKRTFPDGVQTGHTFAYDSLGHLSSHMYPSNLTITYTYDDNGFRNGIWAGNAHLWYLQSHDGIATRYHYGNTTVTDSVSMAGQLLERYVRRDGQNGKLCRMAFTWNGTGNMTSRTGVKGAGVTESFTYDSLDRLTAVRQGGAVTDSLTYGTDGNILFRTGMGAYGYLSMKPHAVTQVVNTAYMITSASQEVAYNPFGKAALIKEGNRSQRLFCGPDGNRWLQVDSVSGQATSRTYYHDGFEMRVTGGHTYKYHYLEEGLLTYMYDSSVTDHYYLLTDNVGSVVHVVNGEGGTVFDAGYDAWGKQVVTNNVIGFHRGYGGHEMLSQYRLVNMDGRLYDYTLGRFLSPDRYVQEPLNSQNFNRYSYCLNNPLRYTDPDGESFFGTIINFFKDLTVNTVYRVWSEGIKAWTNERNWRSTINSYKIETGLFRGNLKQIVSRFIWEAPQTALGYMFANTYNFFYGVRSVSFFDGATAVEAYNRNMGGVTLGSYIIGEKGLHADPYNKLFQHEYGHYLQSQSSGLFYLQRYGMPSLFDCLRSEASKNIKKHKYHSVEQDANIRAYQYFHEHISGYHFSTYSKDKGWNPKNDISGYIINLPYDDPANQAVLRRKLHLGWTDYLFGPITECPPVYPSIWMMSINLTPSMINFIALHQ